MYSLTLSLLWNNSANATKLITHGHQSSVTMGTSVRLIVHQTDEHDMFET